MFCKLEWCLGGLSTVCFRLLTSNSFTRSPFQHKQSSCTCLDPTVPKGRLDSQQWARVHHFNKEAAESSDVDVLFLGDSITEGWVGTTWGRKNAKVHNVPEVFSSLFSVEHGGEYEGLALGIAGDSVSNCGMFESILTL